MHQQMMYYADERGREMELAAAERQMGCSCSPFGRMISRAIKGGNGREGRSKKEMFDYARAYPPAQTYYVRPKARTITVTTNNHQPANAQAHTIPPEPTRAYAAVHGAAAPPQAAGAGKPRKKKKKKRVTFTPATAGQMPANAQPRHADPAPPHAALAVAASSTGATAGSVYHHGAAEPFSWAPPVHGGQGYAYGYGYSRYAPSPLTRWEVVGTPRRHEYFSGEYRWYYPTPVRESIYSFASDAKHRLSTIFSEENPNACTIV